MYFLLHRKSTDFPLEVLIIRAVFTNHNNHIITPCRNAVEMCNVKPSTIQISHCVALGHCVLFPKTLFFRFDVSRLPSVCMHN